MLPDICITVITDVVIFQADFKELETCIELNFMSFLFLETGIKIDCKLTEVMTRLRNDQSWI